MLHLINLLRGYNYTRSCKGSDFNLPFWQVFFAAVSLERNITFRFGMIQTLFAEKVTLPGGKLLPSLPGQQQHG